MKVLRRSNLLKASVAVLALAALLPRPVAAMSAIAAGIPDNVATGGVAFGESWNSATRDQAEQNALEKCRTEPNAPASTLALCKIIAHFDHRCAAVSLDPKDGTPGFGWAVADQRSQAEDQAIALCHQTSEADRAPYCVVTWSDCDTSP